MEKKKSKENSKKKTQTAELEVYGIHSCLVEIFFFFLYNNNLHSNYMPQATETE